MFIINKMYARMEDECEERDKKEYYYSRMYQSDFNNLRFWTSGFNPVTFNIQHNMQHLLYLNC